MPAPRRSDGSSALDSTGNARPNMASIAFETIAATALGLFLSLRLDAPAVWLLIPIAVVAFRGKTPSDYGLDVRFRPPSWKVHLLLGANSAQRILVSGSSQRRHFCSRKGQ